MMKTKREYKTENGRTIKDYTERQQDKTAIRQRGREKKETTLTTARERTPFIGRKKIREIERDVHICRVQNLLGLLLRLPSILTFFVSYRAGRLADRSMTSDS